MARPSLLTPEMIERMSILIRAGNTDEIAAQSCGLGRSTFYDWMNKHPVFRDAVEKARGECEATLVTRIAAAAQRGSWQAALILLERRYPDRWAKGARGKEEVVLDEQDPFRALDELEQRRKAKASG